MATGLLRKTLTAGLRCRFYRAQDLLDDLYASLADRSTPRAIKMLSSIDLLVIDELGYLKLTAEQCNAFFKLMKERYGKKSTTITTNIEYEQWYGSSIARHSLTRFWIDCVIDVRPSISRENLCERP